MYVETSCRKSLQARIDSVFRVLWFICTTPCFKKEMHTGLKRKYHSQGYREQKDLSPSSEMVPIKTHMCRIHTRNLSIWGRPVLVVKWCPLRPTCAGHTPGTLASGGVLLNSVTSENKSVFLVDFRPGQNESLRTYRGWNMAKTRRNRQPCV